MNKKPQALNTLLDSLVTSDANYATEVIDRLLAEAVRLGASDLHLQPTAEGLWVRWRVDGVLQTAGMLPVEIMPNVVSRLKVMAGLLTYQTDRPQEGRVRDASRELDVRVSTFPTLHGEKAVVRLLASKENALRGVGQLGLPQLVEEVLKESLSATNGAILFVGPAGSGKTTTAYACLREIVSQTESGRSVASLEDPIEAVIDRVAQSSIHTASGFDLATGLRSLVRQDPEVIFIGEIRDTETAATAFQAAMTGQLLLTTFHASSTVEAITRLLDMGVPPYVVRGATRVLVAQRLLRKLCNCAASAEILAVNKAALPPPFNSLPTDLSNSRSPVGCEACHQTGYRGRVAVAELLTLDDANIAQAVLESSDSRKLAELASSNGMATVAAEGIRLVENGTTSPAEWIRVFGFDAMRTAN